jgi:DNA-directed RNA polymerase subunit L
MASAKEINNNSNTMIQSGSKPELVSKKEDNKLMKFTMKNIPLSCINAIRRIIISEIPVVGFKTAPHTENQCEILVNTTRFNNEILKHRLSCIPVHIKDNSVIKTPAIPLENYELEVHKKNDTSDIIYVTTEDFRILDKNTGNFLSKAERDDIFPHSEITGDYIDFVRLRPRFTSGGEGEEISLKCAFSVMVPDSSQYTYNSTSRCFFTNTIDAIGRNDGWEAKAAEIKTANPDADMEFEKKNWMALEGNRYYKQNSYDFELKTLGVYTNQELLISACFVMIDKLKTLLDTYADKVIVSSSISTLPNAFDVKVKDEDYTLGKVLADFLYANSVERTRRLSYLGFIKEHPHDNFIKYTMSFGMEQVDSGVVEQVIGEAANDAIQFFENVKSLF